MQRQLVTILGKTIKKVGGLYGGGSALPGLVVERLDPEFINATLRQLPMGIVIISGTNGKTTTAKIVVELLEGQGLKVFSNKTGSNFTRGVAAALLGSINMRGKLKADIAVLELDEAYATHLAKTIPPKYCLLLNVMRDQLDRFGEIDSTAKLLAKVAKKTTQAVVLNREDERLVKIASDLPKSKVHWFGLDKKLLDTFPSDDRFHDKHGSSESKPAQAEVLLTKLDDSKSTYQIDGKPFDLSLNLTGLYNTYNAAAAIALVKAIMKDDLNLTKMLDDLSKVRPAFGRGERFSINSQPLELVLIKNPAGFQLAINSFQQRGYQTMILINDNYADSRDVSWLWDVDFSKFKQTNISQISGIRAYDMALRLQYEDIKVDAVNTNIKLALGRFISSNPDQPKRIYATYTAMIKIRQLLKKYTKVEVVK